MGSVSDVVSQISILGNTTQAAVLTFQQNEDCHKTGLCVGVCVCSICYREFGMCIYP